MILVRMHIAIGQQAEKVQGAIVGPHLAHDLTPGVARKHAARGDGVVDQLGALVERSSGAKGIVPDFAVANIRIARQAHGRAMRPERGIEAMGLEPIHGWRPGQVYRIAIMLFPFADAVHDYD